MTRPCSADYERYIGNVIFPNLICERRVQNPALTQRYQNAP